MMFCAGGPPVVGGGGVSKLVAGDKWRRIGEKAAGALDGEGSCINIFDLPPALLVQIYTVWYIVLNPRHLIHDPIVPIHPSITSEFLF